MLDPYRAHLLRLPFLLAVAASVVILFTPASGVPTAPPGTDKIVHLLLFAALTVTGALAFPDRTSGVPRSPLLLGLGCYALLSEVLQAVLPLGRSADVTDALADLLGAGLGWALLTARYRRDPKAAHRSRTRD